MYRVTTPEHTFILPEDASTYAVIQISYRQGAVSVVKTCSDGVVPSGVTISENKVVVTLTQAETKSFKAGGPVLAQVRAVDSDGMAYASKRFPIEVEEVNNEDILE